jgi:hypothetical protein
MKQIYQKILADKKLLGLYILVEIVLLYIAGSVAIDTARIILYVISFLLVVDISSKTVKLVKRPKSNAKSSRGSSKKA